MSVRAAVPWWSKMAAKIVLSRIPAGYRVWQRLGLFVHGGMDDPAYAWRVVSGHLARAGWRDLHGRTVVELGPGDSLATALIARALGATATWLVDAGPFARTDLGPYVALAALLREKGLAAPPVERFASASEMLDACHARYATGGVSSLAEIPDATVDLVFSQAVLEHVRRREFEHLVGEMRRVLTRDGVASHQVDLKDHLGASLNNLRFSDRVWESDTMARSGFYTNRLRRADIVRIFEGQGFDTVVDGIKRWPALPLDRRALSPAFRALPEDELTISQFDIVAMPRLPPASER